MVPLAESPCIWIQLYRRTYHKDSIGLLRGIYTIGTFPNLLFISRIKNWGQGKAPHSKVPAAGELSQKSAMASGSISTVGSITEVIKTGCVFWGAARCQRPLEVYFEDQLCTDGHWSCVLRISCHCWCILRISYTPTVYFGRRMLWPKTTVVCEKFHILAAK